MKYMEENLNLSLAEVNDIMQLKIRSSTMYCGVQAQKNPLDLWVYRELIWQIKPDVIVEVGNHYGGSTLALAHILDIIGKGKVVGIDKDHMLLYERVRHHPRINLITGMACECIDEVKKHINEEDVVMVIEDSSHRCPQTLKVLETYGALVTVSSYLIVEDTICWHGLDYGPNPGPYEAVEIFMKENENYEIDRSQEYFLITGNPKGFLKRIK